MFAPLEMILFHSFATCDRWQLCSTYRGRQEVWITGYLAIRAFSSHPVSISLSSATIMALPTARYADYFRSAPDPYGGDCTAAFAAFLPPGPPSAMQLFETMRQPDSGGAFAYLGPDTRVHVLHSLRRHTVGTFGQAPSPFAASTFAIRGERTDAGATYVLVEPALLDEVQADHVRSADEIAAGLLANPTVAQLTAETTGGDALVTRSCILIPHCYVSPLLEASATRGDGLEPQEFWSLIETFTAAPEYQAASEPFLDWACIALSQGAGRKSTASHTCGCTGTHCFGRVIWSRAD
jgi:hypothetical protein